MKKNILLVILALVNFTVFSQEKLQYQEPPESILELVNAPLAPSVIIDSKGENVVLIYRDTYKSIAELSVSEMRLAGLRINPQQNIGSRTTYYNNIKVKKALAKEAIEVKGLPKNPRLSNFSLSPNEKMIACLNTTKDGTEVWILDIEKATVKKLTETVVNANMRNTINWFKDNDAMLVKVLPENRKSLIDTQKAIPLGPTVSVSDGAKAQNRTYQDLLKNPNDEQNFEQLAYSELKKVSIDGVQSDFLPAAMYNTVNFSPNGNFVMVSHIKKTIFLSGNLQKVSL